MLKSTFSCLQRCHWQYGSIFLDSFSCCYARNLRNPAKFSEDRTFTIQGHPRSSILVSIESAYATSY